MEPRIETINEKKLIGRRAGMTLAADNTKELWQYIMPRRSEIRNNLNEELLSVQLFNAYPDFKGFDHDSVFEKWAAIEVADFSEVPEGFEMFTLPAGLYAIFHYKGAANAPGDTLYSIFTSWFPASAYNVDNDRPHFAVMGDKYKGNDPDSEEDICIPIKPKQS